MKKDLFNGKVLFLMSEKKDGAMNFVGHEEYDKQRISNRQKFLMSNQISLHDIVIPKPIHGNGVEIVGIPNEAEFKADAIITDKKELPLGMTNGDCPTLVLYDSKNEVLALVHCGWRSLAQGIIEETVMAMHKQFNTEGADIEAFVSPGIQPEYYQVSPDFGDGMLTTIKMLRNGENGKEHPIFSLQNEIWTRFKRLSISGGNITISKICTSSCKDDDGNDRFFSFRRDKSDPLSTQLVVVSMNKK